MKKKKLKLLSKDNQLLEWLKKGGREDGEKDFLALLKRAAQPKNS